MSKINIILMSIMVLMIAIMGAGFIYGYTYIKDTDKRIDGVSVRQVNLIDKIHALDMKVTDLEYSIEDAAIANSKEHKILFQSIEQLAQSDIEILTYAEQQIDTARENARDLIRGINCCY